MLSQAELSVYRRDGFIVLPDILDAAEIEALRRATDEFVRNSRTVVANDDIYDLEDSHSAAEPRVRRILPAIASKIRGSRQSTYPPP